MTKLSIVAAGVILLSTAAMAAEPIFGAYIPGDSPWVKSMLYDYMPVKHTLIGDVPAVMPTVGVDITAEQYNKELNYLLNIAGPTPASQVPPHNYSDGRSGWGMTTIDPRTVNIPCCDNPLRNSPFTAKTLDTFIKWAAMPGVLPTIPHSDFTPFAGGTLTEKSSLYLGPGPYEQIIDNVSVGDIVSNGITFKTMGKNIDIAFTPGWGISIDQFKKMGGYVDINWVSTITHMPDGPSPFYAWNNGDPINLTNKSTPFSDPPPGGGYTYEVPPYDSAPVYYKKNDPLRGDTDTTVLFHDAPSNPDLQGGYGCANGQCDPPDSYESFETRLVGVRENGSYDNFGVGVDWKSNYNGILSGGVFDTKPRLASLDSSDVIGDWITIDKVYEISTFNGDTQPAVPELRTWLMVIMGFFGLGFVNSRRRYY